MFMIKRSIEKQINAVLGHRKAIVVYGARQVGKTTLAKVIAKKYKTPLLLNCDNASTALELSQSSQESLNSMVSGHDFVLIDEAQKVKNIGNAAKLIIDNNPDVQLFLTGSSSLDLSNTIKEPLTGRVFEYILYPLSYQEIGSYDESITKDWERLLVLGSYPEVVTSNLQIAQKIINQIAEQYSYKDVLQFSEIRDIDAVHRLLTALALQIGCEVSYNELSNTLGISRKSVERYIWLLEQAFIIYRLAALTGNKRKTLSTRKRKIYFYDLGIRNAIIKNFNRLDLRNDVGALFENYCINEKIKKHENFAAVFNKYYFRTATNKGEIDYVEEIGGKMNAFEFKWSNGNAKVPLEFKNKYPKVNMTVINKNNVYKDFLANKS
jgi:predicted AAA+ superfamily ATPase